MGWVEELKPDDDVEVEIIYPREYIEYSKETMRKYSRAISYLCKGTAMLGKDDLGISVEGITVLQSIILKNVLAKFGIKLDYEFGDRTDGPGWTYFYADLRELRKRMNEDGEFDFEEEWE